MKVFYPLVLFVVMSLFGSASLPAQEPLIPDMATRAKLLAVLQDISDWSISADLAGGELKVNDRRRTSIFTNSNLARILLAAYDITKEKKYRDHALLWFDRLVALQQTTLSSRGDTVGYWGDMSPHGNIYLGDSGTTATALAGAVRYTQCEQQTRYLQALQRYADFVRFGCKNDPQNKNRGGSPGWIIEQGADQGAIGCGYYRGQLSLAPYTIATSVTGAAFFSLWYQLTGDAVYQEISEKATTWLLRNRRPDGEMPYILHDRRHSEWPLDTMSYLSDGVIAVYLHSQNAEIKKEIVRSAQRSLQWILNRQTDQGIWGKMRSEDQQRSQGILNLLVWYYSEISPNARVLQAIRDNYGYFLQPEKAAAFGVKELPITTGFVGLGIAEVLQPGITYRMK
jgi:hypothetical protein